MSIARMGEGLGYRRPGRLSIFLQRLLLGLPRLDPNQYGVADYDFYAGPVNFNVAKQNGLRRPILRVGQGANPVDAQFKASAANSKGVFPSRDFYWMLDSHQSANGQAVDCAALLVAYGNPDADSILFADFELAPVDASFLWGFLATFRSLLPSIRLGIYTGYSYWGTYGSLDPKYSFGQYLLWIAWPVDPYISPKPLAPWGTNWYYHQWTFNGDGSYYGASGGLDLDYRNPVFSPLPPPPLPQPGGTTMKGMCKPGLIANIKSMSGAAIPFPHTLQGGEYVFGDWNSATPSLQTDLINFSHYYTAAGVKTELGTMCKVSAINLTVTNEAEPVPPPPPPVPTVPHFKGTLTDANGVNWGIDQDFTKL